MSLLIDLAIGRGCHFCPERTVQNSRVRRRPEGADPEDLAVPLCARHRAMLQAAGEHGRLHTPTNTRWWYLGGNLPEPATPLAGCPVSALVPVTPKQDGE